MDAELVLERAFRKLKTICSLIGPQIDRNLRRIGGLVGRTLIGRSLGAHADGNLFPAAGVSDADGDFLRARAGAV